MELYDSIICINHLFDSKEKMSNTKKQHYVPQLLLKRFGVGKKNKEKLWVLDKKTERVFQSSVRDVGHENNFYQFVSDNGVLDPEKLLEKVETFVAPIISKINKLQKLSRTKHELIGLSYLVATQILRSPHVRNEMENIRQLLISKWGSDIRVHPDDFKTLGEYGPDDAKLSSLKMMSDIPDFAKLLQEKVWSLCEAPSNEPFIISDNPVAMNNMIERKNRGNLGLRNEGIEIYLPLSPRYTLQALCPKLSFAAMITPETSEKYKKALEEGTPIPHKAENVEFLNSQQVIWAERFVYAKTRKHLEMPCDMLRTNPELKEGPGVRQRKDEI